MECPNCKLSIGLTWGRYFKFPMGRFVCPSCTTEFKFRRNLQYYLWISIWAVVFFIGTLYIVIINEHGNIWVNYFIWVIINSIIYFPIDKSLESKLETKPK